MSAISDAADRAERGNWGPGDPYQNDDNCKQEDADLRVLIDAAREHESLTAQLQAARATIAEAKYGECAACGKPYERFDSPGGVFYSHLQHPDDDHDATPLSTASLEQTEANRG